MEDATCAFVSGSICKQTAVPILGRRLPIIFRGKYDANSTAVFVRYGGGPQMYLVATCPKLVKAPHSFGALEKGQVAITIKIESINTAIANSKLANSREKLEARWPI
jgi:hypothetical protein